MNVIFLFHPDTEVKMLDNEVGMKVPRQNLVEWFVLEIDIGISINIQTRGVWETAKRAVEIAIEENEETALRYIEEQQKDAGGITCL